MTLAEFISGTAGLLSGLGSLMAGLAAIIAAIGQIRGWWKKKASKKTVKSSSFSPMLFSGLLLIGLSGTIFVSRFTSAIVGWKTNIERDIRELSLRTEGIEGKMSSQASIIITLEDKLINCIDSVKKKAEATESKLQSTDTFYDKLNNKVEKNFSDQNQSILELKEVINCFPKEALVGTIVAHALPPEVVARNYGEDILDIWAPADGREVSTQSEYAVVTGRTILPDLRGVFIRGLNAFDHNNSRADGRGDPDGNNRRIGDYQEDDIRAHKHEYLTVRFAESNIQDSSNPAFLRWFNSADKKVFTDDAGGKETRPINVAVYYYIKIN